MDGYKEFVSKVRKVNGNRKHAVTNSIGVYDIYKYIRKNKWFGIPRPLKEKEFYSIIRRFNRELAKELALGNEIVFPYKMGTLDIRKFRSKIEFKDGKVITNLPINWDATTKLWYEDKEAYNNKTLVRNEIQDIYSINYDKTNAVYNNKVFYDFFPNRELKKNLNKNIKAGKVTAYLYNKYG